MTPFEQLITDLTINATTTTYTEVLHGVEVTWELTQASLNSLGDSEKLLNARCERTKAWKTHIKTIGNCIYRIVEYTTSDSKTGIKVRNIVGNIEKMQKVTTPPHFFDVEPVYTTVYKAESTSVTKETNKMNVQNQKVITVAGKTLVLVKGDAVSEEQRATAKKMLLACVGQVKDIAAEYAEVVESFDAANIEVPKAITEDMEADMREVNKVITALSKVLDK